MNQETRKVGKKCEHNYFLQFLVFPLQKSSRANNNKMF